MNPILYFIVKFFPFWAPIVAVSVLPLMFKLFKRRSYLAGFGLFFLISALVYLTFLYVTKDGYHNAVPFFRQWLDVS